MLRTGGETGNQEVTLREQLLLPITKSVAVSTISDVVQICYSYSQPFGGHNRLEICTNWRAKTPAS